MTGLLLFILLIAAIAVVLEAQHRHVKRLGPEAPVRHRGRGQREGRAGTAHPTPC